MRNPYGGRDYGVSLKPEDVTAYVFWTRNIAPFMANVAAINSQSVPFCVQFTVTGYARQLERSTIQSDHAVAQINALRQRFGLDCAVWRYDPLLFSSQTPPDHHRETFRALAQALKGSVSECVISFATVYAKTRRRLDALSNASGAEDFHWWDPPDDEKQDLLRDLAAMAAENNMSLTLCSQPNLLVDGVTSAKCMDLDRLSRVAGRPLVGATKGNRPGCLCAQSRDIGAYDTCPHGCVYCYAVRNTDKTKVFFREHRPGAPSLSSSPAESGARSFSG